MCWCRVGLSKAAPEDGVQRIGGAHDGDSDGRDLHADDVSMKRVEHTPE